MGARSARRGLDVLQTGSVICYGVAALFGFVECHRDLSWLVWLLALISVAFLSVLLAALYMSGA